MRAFLAIMAVAVAGSAWLFVGQAGVALAQPDPFNEPGEGVPPGQDEEAARRETQDDGVPLVSQREMTQRLLQARRLLEREEYAAGLARLQSILDHPEDLVFQPDREDRTHFSSLKAEALRLIVTLPEEGRRQYESEYGHLARRLLDEALQNGDVDGLNEIVRRYFHTEAGYRATYALGSIHLDQAEPLTAALHFERLRNVPAGAGFDPMLTLKAAVSWHQAGLTEQSRRTVEALREASGAGGLVLGGERVELFDRGEDPAAWLVALVGEGSAAARSEVDGWIQFRGNAARNATAAPANPVGELAWRRSTLTRPETGEAQSDGTLEAELASIESEPRARGNLLALPAVHPLVVGDLVVYRTLANVRALDAATGETVWEAAHVDPLYEQMIEQDGPPSHHNHGGQPSQKRQYLGQRAWRDLTFGTLSSDGRHVYSVEDLTLPGPGMVNPFVVPQASAADEHNRLLAFDLESQGKLKWEIGGPRGSNVPLAGTFFLGPPLPLGGQLYGLAEEGGEIRLLVLEPDTGRLEWAQRLIHPEQRLQQTPVRRLEGLTPSYAEGILVCPTGAGAVVAVDLARRLLLWRYHYPPNVSQGIDPRRAFMLGQRMPIGQQQLDDEERWLDSAATLADGSVLITPRDSNELHCVDLAEGTLRWKKPRGQGLYVAAVHKGKAIVAGRSQVEAWNLSDGSAAWKEPATVSMPAGRGVRSGRLYHLPLSTGEMATLDLDNGRVLAWSPAGPSGALAGNLVAAGGRIVSQTADSIFAFRPADEIRDAIELALQRDPEDAEALALRGELRLHAGEEQDGMADLRRAITLKSHALRNDWHGAPLEAAARQALGWSHIAQWRETAAGALLEGLRTDFGAYRARADEIDALTLLAPAQRARFLRLYAAGLQDADERTAAFAEYVKLAALDLDQRPLEPLGGAQTARIDRWIRPRVLELYGGASEPERARMDQVLRARLDAAREAEGPQGLRAFLDCFGDLRIGDEARRALVERLDPSREALELARTLERLRRSPDRETAASATALLARLLIEAGRPEDALHHLAELADRWSDVVCLDGLSGSQLAELCQAEEPVARAAARRAVWSKHRLSVKRVNRSPRDSLEPSALLEVVGSSGPYCEGWTFSYRQRSSELVAQDGNGEERWRLALDGVDVAGLAGSASAVRIEGHLLLAVFGSGFVTVDLFGKEGAPRVLWSGDLQDAATAAQAGTTQVVRPVVGPAGVVRMGVLDALGRPIGTLGPITDDFVCFQAGSTLRAADPLTGEALWEHDGLPRGSELFGDAELLFVVPPGANQALVFRGSDGSALGVRDLPEEDLRHAVRGRHLLWWNRSGDGNRLTLTDVWSGETRWERAFSRQASLDVVQGNEVGVLDPEGRFVLLGMDEGDVRIDAAVEPDDRLSQVYVRRGRDRYVVLSYSPTGNPNLVNPVMYNNPLVQGHAYGFDRRTGERLWSTELEPQALNPSQPADLPVLIFMSRVYRPPQPGGFHRNQIALTILDTRNGTTVHEEESPVEASPTDLAVDLNERTIDLRFLRSQIELRMTDEPL